MRSRTMMFGAAGLVALAVGLLGAMGAAPARAAADGEQDMWDIERAKTFGEIDVWPDLKAALFEDKTITDGAEVLALETPYRALDAAIVPITITAKKPQNPDSYIKDLYLIIDQNPSPVAAVFHLTPESGNASISTRVRIDKYTYVRAVAETNDGQLYMVANFVKATGGCSAPGLTDRETAMARLGKMKMKLVKPGMGDEPGQAQLLISHPNFTGLQFDQVKRQGIPADFVRSIQVSHGDIPVLSVEADISLSENPSIFFYFLDRGAGELKATVHDSEDRHFEKSWPITRVDG